jgi:hypothetical protein
MARPPQGRRRFPDSALPPRRIPLSLRLQVAFGGFSNQFGWAFTGVGLAFFWIFGLRADLTGLLFLLTPVDTAPGQVLSTEVTSYSEGGGDDTPGTPVYAIQFGYSARNEDLQSTCYSTGHAPPAGGRVAVEYLTWDPEVARIEGTRRNVFGPFALIVSVFPLVGLAFLYGGVSEGIKANQLLGGGRFAYGVLIGSEPTGARINERPVYRLTFEFTAHDGSSHQVVKKTHLPHPLEDEAEEPLLYDPADPAYALMLDGLPGPPRVDVDGSLLPGPLGKVLLLLILPGLTLLGHGWYGWMAWFR